MSPSYSLEESAAQQFGFDGTLVRLRLPEGPVTITVHVDEQEHLRRCEAQVGPFTDRRDIAALWHLPIGISVPASHVPASSVSRLARMGNAVGFEGESLTRTIRPPTRVTGALAVGRNPRSLLRRVCQLSAVAPRGIVVRAAVDSDDAGLLDAALFRVGVMRNSSGGLETLCLPGSVRPHPSRFLWWVSELAYADLISSGLLASPRLPLGGAHPSAARP